MNGTQFAGQRKFAQELVFRENIRGQLTRCGEDAQGNRQIKATAILGQIGWREIDGDSPLRHIELRTQQRGANAILAFLHRRFGQADDGHRGQRQADDGHRGQPTREVDLNLHWRCRNAVLGSAMHDRQ